MKILFRTLKSDGKNAIQFLDQEGDTPPRTVKVEELFIDVASSISPVIGWQNIWLRGSDSSFNFRLCPLDKADESLGTIQKVLTAFREYAKAIDAKFLNVAPKTYLIEK